MVLDTITKKRLLSDLVKIGLSEVVREIKVDLAVKSLNTTKSSEREDLHHLTRALTLVVNTIEGYADKAELSNHNYKFGDY